MKILIIGSKGFIGSNIAAYYSNTDHIVFGCDVVVDYISENYFLIDSTNSDFHSVFENKNFDLCINCSGAASVPDSLSNPLRDFNLNTLHVFKILDAIRLYQPSCKFVNLSSAAVYGNPAKLPITENQSVKPLSPYGYHKRNAEQILEEFYHFFGIATCSLRIFSAYGDGLKKQLFWDLYKKAKSGNSFTLYGTGNESRDFIYINDLLKAIDLAANNSHFKADIINVANGEEIFIKDAVNIFFTFFNSKINYTFSGEERKGDPNNWLADISRLKAFGYQPSFDLKSGLQKYYTWITTIDAK